ncbi:uncharacterized protein LOC119610830 isoform X2 [Lucilia sericata]|nr:uncharacterized protein LOC119610830 isoform X2 [Lucilia sericata]XP_037822145.1 uncharacterized protein LOC119610830 isoform X2 [Lucilia sericata]
MDFNSIETKTENWNSLSEEVDIGETLLNILDEVRSLKNEFEKSDEESRQLIQNLKSEIQQLKSKVRTVSTNIEAELQLLPRLPMNTLEDLKEFDDKLPLDDDLRAELKIFLQRCDGRDYAVFLRDGLRALVTDELAVNLTWRGTPEKPSVQTFTCFVILRDICLSKFPNVNHFDVNRKCQQHFLHAKDRVIKKKSSMGSIKRLTTITSSSQQNLPHAEDKITKNKEAVEDLKFPTTPTFSSYSLTVRPMTPDLLEPLPSPPSPAANLPRLPLKTLQSLEEFDDQLLENSKLKKILKQYINKVGGNDYAKFLRCAFKAMMTDEVALQVTWRGTKEKQSIQEFTIFHIIRDACYAKYPEASKSEINKVCQKHFLYAKDRLKKKSRISI